MEGGAEVGALGVAAHDVVGGQGELVEALLSAERAHQHVGPEVAGDVLVDPAFVVVVGPESEVAKIDSVKLAPVRIDSRRDTLRARAMPQSLPEWCSTDPVVVTVRVPIRHAGP